MWLDTFHGAWVRQRQVSHKHGWLMGSHDDRINKPQEKKTYLDITGDNGQKSPQKQTKNFLCIDRTREMLFEVSSAGFSIYLSFTKDKSI